jgi:hypothetical protein
MGAMKLKTVQAAYSPRTGVIPRPTSIAATMDITVEGKISSHTAHSLPVRKPLSWI